ncbi:hypothetical protein [Streptomyces sp. NPDC001091]
MTGHRDTKAVRDAVVNSMLGEMADRLEANRPDEPITAIGRIALIQATTFNPASVKALQQAVPEITDSVIRRDLAARLREIAGAQ